MWGAAHRLGDVFNLSGSELVFLLLLALIVLGPEKLPDAVRKFGKTYSEVRKMANGFQTELKNALDEPMREMRGTADALRKAANLDGLDGLVSDTTKLLRGETAAPVDPAPVNSAPPSSESGEAPGPADPPLSSAPIEAGESSDGETSRT